MDRITAELDESIMEKQGSSVINRLIQQPLSGIRKIMGRGPVNYTEKIGNNESGSRLQDVALYQAASSYWWAGGRSAIAVGQPLDAPQDDLLDTGFERA